MVLELGFILKFIWIQNFELILDMLDILPTETFLKPSVSSLKQPGMLAASLWKKTSLNRSLVRTTLFVLTQAGI